MSHEGNVHVTRIEKLASNMPGCRGARHGIQFVIALALPTSPYSCTMHLQLRHDFRLFIQVQPRSINVALTCTDHKDHRKMSCFICGKCCMLELSAPPQRAAKVNSMSACETMAGSLSSRGFRPRPQAALRRLHLMRPYETQPECWFFACLDSSSNAFGPCVALILDLLLDFAET